MHHICKTSHLSEPFEAALDGKWEGMLTWHVLVPVVLTVPPLSGYSLVFTVNLKTKRMPSPQLTKQGVLTGA